MSDGGDTIFALSSGPPPAAIAIVRLSGPGAISTLERIAGRLPAERHLTLRAFRDGGGQLLDRGMAYWARGPATATGEDVVELHIHGGRAVVAAMLRALDGLPGLRLAAPGEFTRRALFAGRIDLAEAEALADLMTAETERQRRAALHQAGGAFSRMVEGWRRELLRIAAMVEARIEFAEADALEVAGLPYEEVRALRDEFDDVLSHPPAERLRDGIRVVIAGPPNAGKSTLLNAIAGRDVAITSPAAGTTRDLIETPVALAGIPFVFIDTAGLRDSSDAVETEGVERALAAIDRADILLWLGHPSDAPVHLQRLIVHPQLDRDPCPRGAELAISALRGDGMAELVAGLIARAEGLLPKESEISLNVRQRTALRDAGRALGEIGDEGDELILAEQLRRAMCALDAVTGRAASEDMLDLVFSSFCIGK